MKFNTTKNKIRKVYDSTANNDHSLDNKKNKLLSNPINTSLFRASKLLLDTGWISSGASEGNIFGGDAYLSFNRQTNTVQNQIVNMNLLYEFQPQINITEEQLQHAKIAVLVKVPPPLEVKAVNYYYESNYDTADYYQIFGDSTRIYEGYTPGQSTFWQSDIDAGRITSALTSKWFTGDIGFDKNTSPFDNWEYRGGEVVSVKSYYNVSLSGDPSGTSYNWESFTCQALDSMSGSSITGTGTHVQSVWSETAPSVWEEEITVTRNVTATVNILEDITKITVKNGQLWKNGVYWSSISIFDFHTDGTLDNAVGGGAYLDQGGTYSRTSGSISVAQLESGSGDKAFRLWYSNKRATEFDMDDQYDLGNLPNVAQYETGSLPYSELSIKINPDPYPVIETDEEPIYASSYKRHVWGKVAEGIYNLYVNGTSIISAPANYNQGGGVDWSDETYSENVYGSFELDSENRDDKQVDTWKPDGYTAEIRLIVSIDNSNLTSHEIKHYKTQKLL